MKQLFIKLFIICSISLFSANLFSQRLEDKETSNLDHNTLFAVQDSSNKYNWKKIDFKSLSETFNPFRTEYGNVSGLDSVAVLHDVSIYPDMTKIENDLFLKYHKITSTNWGGYTNPLGDNVSVFQLRSSIPSANNFQIHATDGIGWEKQFNGNQSRSFTYNKDFIYSSRLPNDTIFNRNQGYFFDLVIDGDKKRRGQMLYNVSTTANGRTSEFGIVTDSLNNNLFMFTHDNTIAKTWQQAEANASVLMYEDSTVINNNLVVNSGLKITELSYNPSSSTDLQAEASSAEIGTMWQLNDSGSWYLVTKISATKLARTAFAEW